MQGGQDSSFLSSYGEEKTWIGIAFHAQLGKTLPIIIASSMQHKTT